MLHCVLLIVLSLGTSAAAALQLTSWQPSVVSLSGPDRRRFLHGLCSNDIEALPLNGIAAAATVDAKGNTLNLMTVVDDSEAERLLIVGPEGAGETQRAFFDKYLFPADKAEVADLSSSYARCFEVVGEQASEAVANALEAADATLPDRAQALRIDAAGCWLLGQSVLGGSGSFAVLADAGADAAAAERLEAAVGQLGGPIASSYESLRIRRGRPSLGTEFGEGAVLKEASPLWLGLWSHVHLGKGCYMGNEIIARVAKAKRQKHELFGVALEAMGDQGREVPGSGVTVTLPQAVEGSGEGVAPEGDGTQPIGVVTSSVEDEDGSFALALLRAPHQRAGMRVSVGGRQGEVVELPFATRAGQRAGGGIEEESESTSSTSSNAGDTAARAKAEAERKAAKLAAMEAKLKAMGLT